MSTDAPSVPMLHPCVTCGCPVQAGDGPGELAWHDCEWVAELAASTLPPPPPPEPGLEELLRKITVSLSSRVDKFNARDLSDVLDSMARLQEVMKTSGETTQGNSSRRLLAMLADED